MTATRSLSLALVAFAACSSHGEPTADSSRGATDTVGALDAASRWVVMPKGYGPVLAGMTFEALGRALGEVVRPASGAGSGCVYVRPAALPKDVLVMLQDDSVARVDVRARGVLTAEGAGVGDTEASVLQRYEGRVRVTPHKYTGPVGHYLTVSAPPDSAHLIVFETDGRTVVNYRAGFRRAVSLVEGCS